MSDYWPWWGGGLGLAAAALSHLYLLDRPLSVSGVYARIVDLRRERTRAAESRRALSEAAVRESLLAETVADMRANGVPEAEIAALSAQARADGPAPAESGPEVGAQLVFLLCVVAGALVSAALSGAVSLQWLPGGLQPSMFGTGPGLGAALFGGGFLVGLGTRLAGGCTSGHGLSGCARLQPASLLATALFFGAGVVASVLLGQVLA